METFRNQMRAKCKLWHLSPAIGVLYYTAYFAICELVLYWKILSANRIHDCSKIILFSKLIYKFPSYA